jgi:hypothetical protein
MNPPVRKIEVDEAAAQALERRAAEIGTSVAAVVSELVLFDQSETASALSSIGDGRRSKPGKRPFRMKKWQNGWRVGENPVPSHGQSE